MKTAVPIVLLCFAGCLPNPEGAGLPPECQATSDCPIAGQVCDEGLCWGAPPPGPYAAMVGPPTSNRGDLVATEIPDLAIPVDGNLSDALILQAPVQIGGRVHLGCQSPAASGGKTAFTGCDATAAIAATISVLRPSRIAGGPQYVDSTTSDPTVASGDSFTINVPRLSLDDAPYTLTITPSDATPIVPGGPTPAQLAPPLTVQVDATDDKVGLDLTPGLGILRTVTGHITDATGYGVAGVRVSALGRFDASRPLERVSTVGVTDATGAYAIYIAQAAFPIVDIVGHPDKTNLTLRLRDVQADKTTQAVPDMRVPAAGKPITVIVPVVGLNGAGVSTPVAGATVDATTQLDDPSHPGQLTTYEVSASTDGKGNASLQVIPASGATTRTYYVRIHPAPTSEFASLYDKAIEVATGAGVLGEIDLPHRIQIAGSLVDAVGDPAGGVTITAEPALRVTLGLDATTKAALSSLQPPTTTTTADGKFFMWVDPDLDGTAASYDLECVPPAGARTPRWTFHDVTLKGPTDNIDLGAIALPPGRHVRGRVVDDVGGIVKGAEVRIYQPVTDASLCSLVSLPVDCVLPASLRAIDRSDDKGWVRLVLPDPPPPVH